jgi:hypothetical protein
VQHVLKLTYDAEANRLAARLPGFRASTTVEVRRDNVLLTIDLSDKRVTAFEIEDFSHFVSYDLLGELFGEEVIRGLAAFQSAVTSSSRRTRTLPFTSPPASGRRVINELLRVA